ncbi:hypothetical protein NMY22_g3113 [Coprinellus aureogranulatus]|nr:hypothetical protein NMY22_g3113 [Coprinellus aureogranulatus]
MLSQETQALLEDNTTEAQCRRDRLTARIRQLKAEITTLEGCYNSLSMPNRLPAEILSNIFLNILLQYRQWISHSGEKEGLRWMPLTQVCRHWRSVALNCPTLWAHISFSSPAITEVMLERSRDAPLVLESSSDGGPHMHEFFCRWLSQPQRLRVVSLSQRDADSLDVNSILSKWSRPAPLLEKLRLSGYEGAAALPFPKGLISGGSPLLRSLALIHCRIPTWISIPLTSALTTLVLIAPFDSEANPARPPWNQFLTSLASMPSLQSLHFSKFLPLGRFPGAAIPPPPIRLSNMRTSTILDCLPSLEAFFNVVQLPNADEVHNYITDKFQDVEVFSRLVANLATSCNFAARPALDAFHICEDIGSGPAFYCTLSTSSTSDLALDVWLNCYDTDLTTPYLLPAFKDHIDFSQLPALYISGDIRLTIDDWKATFAHLQHLKAVTFQECIISEAFLSTLAEEFVSQPTISESDAAAVHLPSSFRPNYPAFETLTLHEVDFAAAYPSGHTTESLLISSFKSRSLHCDRKPRLEIDVFSDQGFTLEMCRRIEDALPDVDVHAAVYANSWHEADDD